MSRTVTAAEVRPFLGQVATIRVESRDATGSPFLCTLTGTITATFPEEIETFGFAVSTGPDEGLCVSLGEVTSITAADPAVARRLQARLALAERHAAEVAALEARHAAAVAALEASTPEEALAAWIAAADFTAPAIDLIDALTEVLQDAGMTYEQAVRQADRTVMPRLI